MSYTIKRFNSTEEWKEERAKGIGSSDAGTLYGVNHFKTIYTLWREKCGLPVPQDNSNKDILDDGHDFEFATTASFERRTGAIIDYENSLGDWLAVDDEHPMLRVSPDRVFWPANTPPEARTPKNWRVLELKSTNTYVDPDNVPDYWYCQIQYQMGILGAKSGALCWVSSLPRLGMHYVEVDFNESFFTGLKARILDFWENNVLARREPDGLTDGDKIVKYQKVVEGKTVLSNDEIEKAIAKYAALSAKETETKNAKSELSKEICAFFQDAEMIVDKDNKVLATYKATTRKSFPAKDLEVFRNEEPELYDRFVKESTSRTLNIKEKSKKKENIPAEEDIFAESK